MKGTTEVTEKKNISVFSKKNIKDKDEYNDSSKKS